MMVNESGSDDIVASQLATSTEDVATDDRQQVAQVDNSSVQEAQVKANGDTSSKMTDSLQQLQQLSPLDASDEEDEAKLYAKQTKRWHRRIRMLLCCSGYKKDKDSIADVANVMAQLCEGLNVTTSDLAAGFVLLSKYQEAQRRYITSFEPSKARDFLSGIPINDETKFLDLSQADDSHLLNDMVYYMNYCLAVFGWLIRLIDQPSMLCCICPYLKFPSCCNKRRSKVAPKPDESSDTNGYIEATTNDVPGNTTGAINCDTQEENGLQRNGKIEGEAHITNGEPLNDESSAEADKKRKKKSEKKAKKDLKDKKAKEKKDKKKADKNIKKNVVGQLNDDCDLPIVVNDNCCGCNTASVKQRMAEHNYEIIYYNYRTGINKTPFLIAADHSKRSIVVAIRGSMGAHDFVTDVNGKLDKIPIDDCPDDWLGHRGMVRAASYIKEALIDEQILARAFNCRPDLESQKYQLVVCGHSLGAGVAAILGIILYKQYPNLKAYLYSPPGGMLTLPVVEFTKKFAVGIILGLDMVARLGFVQVERLRYQTLLSLRSTTKSSGNILLKAMCPGSCLGRNEVDFEPEKSVDLLYGQSGRTFEFNGYQIPFQRQAQCLYVPGRLIHIVRNYNFKSKQMFDKDEPIYQAVWSKNTYYDRVLIGKGMAHDHLPTHLMRAMKMLFSRTLPHQSTGSPNCRLDENGLTKKNDEDSKALEKNVTDGNNNELELSKESLEADKIEAKVTPIEVDGDQSHWNQDQNNNS